MKKSMFRNIIQLHNVNHLPKTNIHTPRNAITKMFENLNLGQVQPSKDRSDMVCKSHRLMIYNNIIHPTHLGGFCLLPFGVKALEKLTKVIDQEMQNIGAQKLAFPCLTSGSLWKESGRWDSAGAELFTLKDRHNSEFCLGPTHEEAITTLLASNASVPYSKLPIKLYQITRKFRDEMNPRYGLLRAREFEMKDLYTFDVSEEKARETYAEICDAYCNLFKRLGLNFAKVEGDTGNIGGKLSHEFHLMADVGEDSIIHCSDCDFASNAELIDDDNLENHKCDKANCDTNFIRSRGIEVGHAFLLGEKYSKIFKAQFFDEKKRPKIMQMGCYGLGVTRLLAAAIEVCSLENQIRWPKLIAPYQICIIPQKDGFKSEVTNELAERLYDQLDSFLNLNNEVLLDDRTHMSLGKRLYECKRLGIPQIVVLGKQALEETPKYEVINVDLEETSFLELPQLLEKLSKIETIR